MLIVARLFLVLVAAGVVAVVVNAQQGQDVVERVESDVPITSPAVYDCDLYNLWTEDRHPAEFPGNSAHWSEPVFASHNGQYSMFKEGDIATDGLKKVAEDGNAKDLEKELEAEQDDGNVLFFDRSKDFDANLGDVASMSGIEMDRRHRLLSMATMIAPSPDWFSGVRRVDMTMATVDDANNETSINWVERIIVNGYPFDAGTQDITTYNFRNKDSELDPRIPIKRIRRSDIVNVGATSNDILLSPEKNTVLAVIRLKCALRGSTQGDDDTCTSEVGESCTENNDGDTCCAGLSCMSDICQPCLVGRQQTCESDDDCCPGLECNAATGECLRMTEEEEP